MCKTREVDEFAGVAVGAVAVSCCCWELLLGVAAGSCCVSRLEIVESGETTKSLKAMETKGIIDK